MRSDSSSSLPLNAEYLQLYIFPNQNNWKNPWFPKRCSLQVESLPPPPTELERPKPRELTANSTRPEFSITSTPNLQIWRGEVLPLKFHQVDSTGVLQMPTGAGKSSQIGLKIPNNHWMTSKNLATIHRFTDFWRILADSGLLIMEPIARFPAKGIKKCNPFLKAGNDSQNHHENNMFACTILHIPYLRGYQKVKPVP